MVYLVSSVSPSGNDPEVPNLVWAKGIDQQRIALIADSSTVRRLEDGGLNAKIGEYCGLIHGAVAQGIGLINAHALFRGLKRPCISEGRDCEIYAYVLSAPHTFIYPRNAKYSGVGPVVSQKPTASVFVAYVDIKPIEADLKSAGLVNVDGSVLYWEWVLSDPQEPSLPQNFSERYNTRIW